MSSAEFKLIMQKLEEIEEQVSNIDPPGHFTVIILLLAIAFKVGAC